MPDHGIAVVQFVDGDFNDLVAVVSQPGAYFTVFFSHGGISVEPCAHTVQIDADTVVILVVFISGEKDIRGGAADLVIQADVSPEADLLLEFSGGEAGGFQQVLEFGFRVIDRPGIGIMGVGHRMGRRDIVAVCELIAPFTDQLDGHMAVKKAVIIAVSEILEAVDTGMITSGGAVLQQCQRGFDDFLEMLLDLVYQA